MLMLSLLLLLLLLLLTLAVWLGPVLDRQAQLQLPCKAALLAWCPCSKQRVKTKQR